jgi:hypothetical protein
MRGLGWLQGQHRLPAQSKSTSVLLQGGQKRSHASRTGGMEPMHVGKSRDAGNCTRPKRNALCDR